MTDIAALLSIVTPTLDAVKTGFNYLKDKKFVDKEQEKKILDLESHFGNMRDIISSLRDERETLQNKCEDMSRQLAIQTDWKNTSELYELVPTIGGAIVYKHKEKDILVCPTCFVDEKKTHPLQDDKNPVGTAVCKNCKNGYQVRSNSKKKFIAP
jgi:hypothetical protein